MAAITIAALYFSERSQLGSPRIIVLLLIIKSDLLRVLLLFIHVLLKLVPMAFPDTGALNSS